MPPEDEDTDPTDAPDPGHVPAEVQDLAALAERPPRPAFPRVDALFSGEPLPPPVQAGPRIRRLRLLLLVAIPLDLLGVPCWTGVPGAALTLLAWLLADGEVARIDAGEYSSEDSVTLMRLRSLASWTLAFCVFSLVAQAWLLGTPFYDVLYDLIWERFPAIRFQP